ncbi:MAG: hypothetical protein LUD72_04720 [Bacteroidales bacterium]|nr:hypothetical protein [Bacteroidales bacterium]
MEKTSDSEKNPAPKGNISRSTGKPLLRNRQCGFRLTPREWAFVEAKRKASGLHRAEYVLHILQERPLTKKETIGKIVRLLRERADILDRLLASCDDGDFEKTRLISLARNRAVQTYRALIDIEVKGGKENGGK